MLMATGHRHTFGIQFCFVFKLQYKYKREEKQLKVQMNYSLIGRRTTIKAFKIWASIQPIVRLQTAPTCCARPLRANLHVARESRRDRGNCIDENTS